MAETGTRDTSEAVEGKIASDGLYLGDAIHFFLSAKRAGGRSERTIDDYRKKLGLFQRWMAARLGGGDENDATLDVPYIDMGEIWAPTTSRSTWSTSRNAASRTPHARAT